MNNSIKKYIFDNKQNKETSWALIAKGIFIVSGLFFLYFIPNFISIDVYGQFALFFSYLSLLQLFFGSIFIAGANKEITENKFGKKSQQYFVHSIYFTSIFYLISSVIFFIIAPYISINILTSHTYLFLFLMGLTVFLDIFSKLFIFTHRLFYLTLMYVVEYSSKIGLILLFFFYNNLTFETLLISFIVGYLLSIFLGLYITIRKFKIISFKSLFYINKKVSKKILNRSILLALSSISAIILSKVDTIMISFFMTITEVGYYSIAAELTKKASVASIPFIMGVVPLFLSKNNTRLLYSQTVKKLLLINGVLIIGFLVFGRLFIRLMYGDGFDSSVTVLHVLSLMPLLIALQSLAQQLLILRDENKAVLCYSLISAILNIILNYVFIAKFGIVGAASATLISYLTWFGFSARKLKKMGVI
ncbi:MAG: polysaccharide biosynthesis C-terminal domain-containing protein [Patescibacteria group bacterium]|nr:polysaccharide biosynthesis C-terminal domain-containing protein [Patescibacteria group bacterium]